MRNLFKSDAEKAVDGQIAKVLQTMDEIGLESEEYPDMLRVLERLNDVKEQTKPARISRDTIALIFGNLAGILMIIAYEKHNVMTSRALEKVIRPQRI